MRLSTDPDRDEERALATLRAAREAGVRLFDTAAAYGRNAREHHGERLLARAFGAGLGELEVGGVLLVRIFVHAIGRFLSELVCHCVEDAP